MDTRVATRRRGLPLAPPNPWTRALGPSERRYQSSAGSPSSARAWRAHSAEPCRSTLNGSWRCRWCRDKVHWIRSSSAYPDSRCRENTIAAVGISWKTHLTLRLRRDVCFFFSPRREFPRARDGCGGSWWERRTRRRKKNFRTSSKSIMCTSSSPTGWCHCHHDTTSALCRAERRSVGALDRTPLPVVCLASEKSTI